MFRCIPLSEELTTIWAPSNGPLLLFSKSLQTHIGSCAVIWDVKYGLCTWHQEMLNLMNFLLTIKLLLLLPKPLVTSNPHWQLNFQIRCQVWGVHLIAGYVYIVMYGLIISVKRATRRNAAVLTANDKCSAIHCGGKTMACRHSWLGTLHTALHSAEHWPARNTAYSRQWTNAHHTRNTKPHCP